MSVKYLITNYVAKKVFGNDKTVILPGATTKDVLKNYAVQKILEGRFEDDQKSDFQKSFFIENNQKLEIQRRYFTQPIAFLNFCLTYVWLFFLAPLTDPFLSIKARILIYFLCIIFSFWYLFHAIKVNLGYKEFKFAKSWVAYLLFYIPHSFFIMGAIYYFLTNHK